MTRILAAVAAIATAALLAACGNNGYQDPNTSTVHVYNHNVPAAVQPPDTVHHVVTHVNAPPVPTTPRTATTAPKPVAKVTPKPAPKAAKSTKR